MFGSVFAEVTHAGRLIDRGIVTMEDEYKVVCALLNSAAFDDLE